MDTRLYERTQKDTYESLGISRLDLSRPLESDSPMWSIDPMAIMPGRNRVLSGIMTIHDGNNTRAVLGKAVLLK